MDRKIECKPDTGARMDRLAALEEAQELLAFESEPEAILNKLAVAAARIIDAETLAVTMLSDDGREVSYDYAYGKHAGALLGKVLPIDNAGLCGWVLSNRKPILSVNLLDDPRIVKEVAMELGIHTALLTPLIARGKIIGGLSAFNKLDGSKFNEDDLNALSRISGYAALAVVNSRLLRDLSIEKAKAEVVLDSIGDGLIFISGDGAIAEANAAAQSYMPKAATGLVGTNVQDLKPGEPLYEAIGWAAGTLPGERCWELLSCENDVCPVHRTDTLRCWAHSAGHCICHRPDKHPTGKHWDICTDCDVVKAASGRILMHREMTFSGRALSVSSTLVMEKDRYGMFGELVVLHDVTAEKKLEGQRIEFMSMLSHDLKAPISSIMGYSEMIGQEEDVVAIRELNLVVSNNSRRLLGMINDVLEFSRVESGRVVADPAPVSLSALMGMVMESFVPIARERGVELAWEVADGVREVLADIDMLSRIVGNLVMNALEHAGKGKGRADGGGVIVSADKGPEGFVRLEVKDDGPGIEPGELPRIFEKYYSTKGGVFSGKGLGLSIVKVLCELQGGSVGVESEKGRGAVFWVLLPEAKGQDPA